MLKQFCARWCRNEYSSGFVWFGGMKTNSVDNEIEIFKSKKLMHDVVDRLNLQTDVLENQD